VFTILRMLVGGAAALSVAVGQMSDTGIVILAPVSSSVIEPGRPFSADSETLRLTQGSEGKTRHVDRGRIYVNGAGSVRSELLEEDAAMPIMVNMLDAVRRVNVIIDPISNTVAQIPLPEPQARTTAPPPGAPTPRSLPEQPSLAVHRESLGERQVEGLRCIGERTKGFPPGSVVETWRSPELGVVILERLENARTEVTYRLFNIRRGEPDPKLFDVPDEKRPEWKPFTWLRRLLHDGST